MGKKKGLIGLEAEQVTNVSFDDYPGTYPMDCTEPFFNFEKFKKNLQVTIYALSPWQVEFDLVGVDASIANAVRRILIAEVKAYTEIHPADTYKHV